MQMARDMPDDDEALLAVSGVGHHKLEQYGSAFLDVIAAHRLGGA